MQVECADCELDGSRPSGNLFPSLCLKHAGDDENIVRRTGQ